MNQRRWVSALVLLLAGTPSTGLASDSTEAKRQVGENSGREATQEEETEAKKRWRFYWDGGPRLTALWGELDMRFGTEIQNDSAVYANSESVEEIVGDFSGGVEWRRARFFTMGTFHEHFEFKLNYDLAVTSPPKLKDAYFGINKLPFKIPIKIMFGRFQAPLGLEGLTHNTNLTFLERSTLSTAFLPNRNTGFLFWDSHPKHGIRYGIAIIKPNDELGVGASDNSNR